MTRSCPFLLRLWALLRSRQMDRDMDDEIASHLAEAKDEYIRQGLSPEEAHWATLRSFGGVTQSKEVYRQIRSFMWLDDLMRDVRYALRTLRRSPGFATVAIFTLALGIGATTTMFSVVNGVLLRPLPYPEQDRLIEIVHEAPGVGANALFASPAIYFAYHDYGRVFEAVGLWDWDSSPVTVTGAGEPESVTSLEVTREILPILGATPIMGRTFGEADDQPGSAPTALISYGYWQRRFGGGDPVGQTLVVDGVARQIVGVLPQSFRFFDYPADIFYPLQLSRADAVFPSSDGKAIARPKSDVTLAQANADAARIIPILSKEFAPRGADLARLSAELARLRFAPDSAGSRTPSSAICARHCGF